MPAESGVTSPQIVGWIVTGLAFLGNMVWNYKNRTHTNTIAGEIRLENFKQDVWERHRARIDNRLEELTAYVSGLPGQVLALTSPFEPKMREFWTYNLTLFHDALSRALAEADASAHCDGGDWEDSASGNLHGTERSWDILLSLCEQVRLSSSESECIDHLKKMNVYALEIERLVRRKMRDADFRYQP